MSKRRTSGPAPAATSHRIPADLVVLDLRPADLTAEELCRVDDATWYEATTPSGYAVLLVSYCAIGGLTETNPRDADVDLDDPRTEVQKVDHILNRYDRYHFYHA